MTMLHYDINSTISSDKLLQIYHSPSFSLRKFSRLQLKHIGIIVDPSQVSWNCNPYFPQQTLMETKGFGPLSISYPVLKLQIIWDKIRYRADIKANKRHYEERFKEIPDDAIRGFTVVKSISDAVGRCFTPGPFDNEKSAERYSELAIGGVRNEDNFGITICSNKYSKEKLKSIKYSLDEIFC